MLYETTSLCFTELEVGKIVFNNGNCRMWFPKISLFKIVLSQTKNSYSNDKCFVTQSPRL